MLGRPLRSKTRARRITDINDYPPRPAPGPGRPQPSQELVALAVAEGSTILTRDRRLVERRLARNHLLIHSDQVEEQVR